MDAAGAAHVRRMVLPADAEPLTDLHLDCWDDAYPGLVPQQVIDARRARRDERVGLWSRLTADVATWVAEDAGGLVGFAMAGTPRDPSWARPPLELMSLYARARVWGRGVGHDLMVAAIGDAPAYLWVLEGNARAVGFYERHGFVLDGTRKECAEGVDARMVRR